MKPVFQAAPDQETWERPRRPPAAHTQRGPWLAFWCVLALIAIGGWFAFAPADRSRTAGGSTARDPDSSTDPGDAPAADGFRILHASWGRVDDTPPPPPPEPAAPTEWQLRERAFHEMGRERWKGTEIFVRRETR